MLARTGLISFAATLQFAPAILGGLYWSKGNRYGAISAILAGFSVWFYTMVMPALAQSGWLPISLIQYGADSIGYLNPQALFGTGGINALTHTVFWSLLVNIATYIVVSLATTTSREEMINASLFIGILDKDEFGHLKQDKTILINEKVEVIRKIYEDYFPSDVANIKLQQTLSRESLKPEGQISILQLSQLVVAAESTLAGSIGAASAHIAIKRSGLLKREEQQELSATYADVLAELNISPAALKEKVDYYQEREDLYKKNANDLKSQVEKQTTELKATNDHLLKTLIELNETQESLAEADKMAALGGLVAGVAHEINTPLGISITAVSHLDDSAQQFKSKFESGQLTKPDFLKFIDTSNESIRILTNNTAKAAELIKSFKQVAVDQSSEGKRSFDLKDYLDEILLSLKPKIKHSHHQIDVSCDKGINVNSYPGALSQIITNLITNSLMHAFETTDKGKISISATTKDASVLLVYKDNGKGMSEEVLEHLFEPFYTTKRGSGGSGLGAHIMYNLVVQKLQGSIQCKSSLGQGAEYSISFPREPD